MVAMIRHDPSQFVPTGKRANARLRVRLPAKLITLHGEYRLALIDLSASGARVGQPGLDCLPGNAILQWTGHEVFGRIVWVRDGLAGVRFDEPIPDEWVLATRRIAEASPMPGDSELHRHAARDWVSGRI